MYIQPNTTVKVFKNCPLDKSYENTIYFASVSAQTTYFASLSGYTFNNQTYQRVNKGKIRVAMNAEPLYNCNYMAFQNASFGTKWFYAFILSVEYVNNVTSEITYEIDVLQTWHFDYALEHCFIEREHTVTDGIGDNIVEETLGTGDYIIDNYSEPDALDPDDFDIVLFCTVDDQYQPIGGYWNGYMGSGLFPKTFPNTQLGLSNMVTWINGLNIAIEDAIVSACIMPHFMTTSSPAPGWSDAPVTTLMRSDGTAVKNKKCLTYPYNFLYVTNYQGRSAAYRYEFFTNKLACTFDFVGRVTPDPVMLAVPYAYKSDENAGNYDEAIEISGFPQMPWNVDAFKAWLAQSASSIGINALAFTTSALFNNPAGMASSGMSLINQALAGAIQQFMPPQAKGNAAGAGKFSTGKLTYGFMNKHITPEYATIIDDYFTMFGYACHKVKTPNRNARPEWTYVKTVGCKISPVATSGLPGDDMEKIESLYNQGIRWWNTPAHIGNYSYNNAPVTTP